MQRNHNCWRHRSANEADRVPNFLWRATISKSDPFGMDNSL
jgi:hypothetical protein